ncbi:hypothetical protein THOM_2383 [Trachipleistophora hominis]|uniref:Uncharacterized protein n=1 Tax=Trachipleistophora hominis TaxID=72359 RepID=L7JUK3_TRAHO|nr:hypothetical protein THOM_2383 [Trachipleistophora hominis]
MISHSGPEECFVVRGVNRDIYSKKAKKYIGAELFVAITLYLHLKIFFFLQYTGIQLMNLHTNVYFSNNNNSSYYIR